MISRIIFSDKSGSFVTKQETLKAIIKTQGPAPSFNLHDLISRPIVKTVITRESKDKVHKVTINEKKFPHEYSLSGWFKFIAPEK